MRTLLSRQSLNNNNNSNKKMLMWKWLLESFWDLKVSIDRDKKLKDVHGDFFHSIKDAKSFKSTSIDRKGAWKMLNWADTDVQAHTIWINDKLQLG